MSSTAAALPFIRATPLKTWQVERQSRGLDKKSARMLAEAQEEAKEGLRRDAVENREALGLVAAGGDVGDDQEEGEGVDKEVVPPQVLKERIESVVEVLGDFQVMDQQGESVSLSVLTITITPWNPNKVLYQKLPSGKVQARGIT